MKIIQYNKKMGMIFFFIMFMGLGAQAQFIKAAAIAGFNLSQVDGDNVSGYKRIGLNFGVAAIVPFKNNWDITMETLFTQKGAYSKDSYMKYDLDQVGVKTYGKYELRLNYVEIPLLIHYTDKNVMCVGTGFSYSHLVSNKEIELGQEIDPSDFGGAYKKQDFSVLADVRVRVWESLWFNVRYSYSLTPIKYRSFIDKEGLLYKEDQYNNTLGFRFIWVFGDNAVNMRIKDKKQL